MLGNLTNGGAGAFESALDWWRLAGVDVLVDDTPRDWLRTVPPPMAPARSDAGGAVRAMDQLPQNLAELVGVLTGPDLLPELGPRRVAPAGDAASGVMLMTDMPDIADLEGGTLFSGKPGQLLDAMLAAIGLDREAIYIASLFPARPMGSPGDYGPDSRIARFARHHIQLARPKAVLLMGDATTRALCGTSLAEARQDARTLNHDRGSSSAIATFHPRFLIQQPARKADAWRDLRRFVELLRR